MEITLFRRKKARQLFCFMIGEHQHRSADDWCVTLRSQISFCFIGPIIVIDAVLWRLHFDGITIELKVTFRSFLFVYFGNSGNFGMKFYRSMAVDVVFQWVFGTGTVGPCGGPQSSGELSAMNAICRHLCRSTEFAAHRVTGSGRSQKTFHRPVSEKSIVVFFIEIRL